MCIHHAPPECVEHIIRRCMAILKKSKGEPNEEYLYWIEWLGEIMGDLPDSDWVRLRRLVEKNEQLNQDIFGRVL